MRKVSDGTIGVNLALGSVDVNGTANTIPQYTPGEVVRADSGVYIYMSANGAVAEGYAAKFAEGTWDADTVTTAESASTNTPLGICVTSGGLADNQWGWFWRGQGYEYVYVKDSAAADAQLLTTTTAGQVGDTTDGVDPIHDLHCIGAAAGTALSLARSSVLLSTNATITN